jgi:hypothetical protein
MLVSTLRLWRYKEGDNSSYPASRMVYDWGIDIIEKHLKQATDWDFWLGTSLGLEAGFVAGGVLVERLHLSGAVRK